MFNIPPPVYEDVVIALSLTQQTGEAWDLTSNALHHHTRSTNADPKSQETVFSVAICRQSGDKWQSETMFLTIFDLR